MSKKVALPNTKFAHELTAAPVDPTMKAAEATSAKLYKVPVSKIKAIPGFNVRVRSPDYLEHIETLRASIEENGYNAAKPLSGYVAKEGDENVIYVTDGHSRLEAVEAINDDATKAEDKIAALPVLVQPKEVSLADLTVQLHTANNGRPLTPFELGVVVKRLLDEGEDKKVIANRLAVTPRYLDDVLLLANADKDVKQHVAAGAVSSTMAIQLLRKDPDSAAEKIDAAVKKVAGTGKKATKKHTETAKMQKVRRTISFDALDDMKEIVKQAAAEIRGVVPADEGEDDTKVAAVTGSIVIVIEIPAEDKPAPKKKADAEADEKPAAKKAPAKKPAAKKADPKKAPAKKPAAKKAADDLGIDGAEMLGEDDEPAKVPPKVSSDENVLDDEVDI